LTEALYLSEICAKVHILIRKDKARAETIWVEQAKKRENIEFHYNTEVEEIA
jgi:thioredoxin reductase (NADPH)